MGNNNVESGQSMPAEQQIANPGYDINESVDNYNQTTPNMQYSQTAQVTADELGEHSHHEPAIDEVGMKGDDHSDRMGFIKKVYSILFVQLSITAAYIWYVTATATGICTV